MGTRMLLFPGEEHLHRAPSWGGMHDPDMGTPPWMSSYSPSSGGNTWSKRLAATNPNPNPHTNPNSTPNDSESWEVRAFAEDASTSGQWPPRSYSCSFCQREFRTAQALGGHMNVHRRERAQANQLAQLRSTEAPSHHHHNTSNVTPAASLPQDHHAHHHHWLTRETQAADHSYYGTTSSSSSGYEGHHRHAYEESSYPGNSSYGAPEAPFRNYSSPYEGSTWRSPYETSSRDAGLDLELRLGQRYD